MRNLTGSNTENYQDGNHRPHAHAYFSQELLKRIESKHARPKLKPKLVRQERITRDKTNPSQTPVSQIPAGQIPTAPSQPKYRTSSLSVDDINTLASRLTSHLEQQQPYLDFRFTLIDLAQAMNIANHHLSQVINIGLNSNFNQLINRYRIQESLRLIEQDTAARSNITRIQFDSGFGSKSVFHRVFKQQVGMTPKTYWEHCKAKRLL